MARPAPRMPGRPLPRRHGSPAPRMPTGPHHDYEAQFSEMIGFGQTREPITCVHKERGRSCTRDCSSPRDISPDNVRCGSCGHTWWAMDLPDCMRCGSWIYDCPQCRKAVITTADNMTIKRSEGMRPCRGMNTPYCKACLVAWCSDDRKPITMCCSMAAESDADGERSADKDAASICCYSLAGEMVHSLQAEGVTVGDIRTSLNAKLGVRRSLVCSGTSYTFGDFLAWHASETGKHYPGMDGMDVLIPGVQVELFLPDGSQLTKSQDHRHIVDVFQVFDRHVSSTSSAEHGADQAAPTSAATQDAPDLQEDSEEEWPGEMLLNRRRRIVAQDGEDNVQEDAQGGEDDMWLNLIAIKQISLGFP